MPSSGTTAVATTDDNAVEAIPANAQSCNFVGAFSTVAGFIYWDVDSDGNDVMHYLPANTLRVFDVSNRPLMHRAVMIQRIAGGTDMSAFVSTW